MKHLQPKTLRVYLAILANPRFSQRGLLEVLNRDGTVSVGFVNEVVNDLVLKRLVERSRRTSMETVSTVETVSTSKMTGCYILSDAVGMLNLISLFRRMPELRLFSRNIRAGRKDVVRELAGRDVVFCLGSAMEMYSSHFRPEEVSRRAAQAVEPDLHLHGRPFLVAENSPAKVAEIVERFAAAPSLAAAETIATEQLGRLDPELARRLVPEDGPEMSADLLHRRDLLASLAAIRDLADAARRGVTWGEGDAAGKPAAEVLRDEIAWRALVLHARVVPFWVGRDVDGLETICAAASIPPPEVLVPARRVFAGLCEEFPDFASTLGIELTRDRQVGAYVAPDDVPTLLEFLGDAGARIIQAAARYGEGASCSVLLRKMRECATYARRRGFGYLEASGINPPDLEE